jgi:hypothetical protein
MEVGRGPPIDRAGFPGNEDAAGGTHRRRFESLEHETGLEPATPTLATWRSTN